MPQAPPPETKIDEGEELRVRPIAEKGLEHLGGDVTGEYGGGAEPSLDLLVEGVDSRLEGAADGVRHRLGDVPAGGGHRRRQLLQEVGLARTAPDHGLDDLMGGVRDQGGHQLPRLGVDERLQGEFPSASRPVRRHSARVSARSPVGTGGTTATTTTGWPSVSDATCASRRRESSSTASRSSATITTGRLADRPAIACAPPGTPACRRRRRAASPGWPPDRAGPPAPAPRHRPGRRWCPQRAVLLSRRR